MGHETVRRETWTALGALLAAVVLFFTLSSTAQATPFHPRTEALDITGLNHACGAAVDSKGDVYLSSAGESKIKIYDASHKLLTEVADVNEPCDLAVTTTGVLYVSEKATGEVVRFKPNAYPFVGTPTYGTREVIDSSKAAKGIAVDPVDNRLYVAEGNRVAVYKSDGSFEANVGEGTLSEASGVAVFTYVNGKGSDRYLWAADANGLAADRLYLFGGLDSNPLKLRRELSGATTPDGSFGFGAAGAYLAVDPGNRNSEGKCLLVGAQACTAGHLFLYDAAHKTLDEFDATGEYLDRTENAAFADAEPTAIAVDRSGGANDGTVYVTAGAGSGAKALAFGPLKAPSRKTLEEPLSHELENARAVAVDLYGNAYVGAGTEIHVFDSGGTELTVFEDEHKPKDIAVDSACNVYVLDENEGLSAEAEVTYYAPSSCPPKAGTGYSRHEPPVVTPAAFPPPNNTLRGIAVNPGPGAGKDHLFVASNAFTQEYDSAASGSALLSKEFAKCVPGITHLSIAVYGGNGNVYISLNPHVIYVVDKTGECIARIENTGAPNGKIGNSPLIAVDQSNGHLLLFDKTSNVLEYDASGSFVAGFGSFTENLTRASRIAIDSSCAIHEPPLDETTTPTCKEFDPANGTVYLAFDDTKSEHPPYDVNAFGPLEYPAPGKHKLTVKKTGTGSGKVSSSPAGIDCGSKCSAEYEETKVVTLTATPDPEMKFVKWSGCEAEPTATKCEVTMSKDREVTAEFESVGPVDEELKVIIEGPGSGKVTSSPAGIECSPACSTKFGKGVKVILVAKADKGSEFVGWSGCEAEPSPTECEVTMSSPKEVKAEFDVEHPLLTVVKKGLGAGTVTSEPSGIDCGATCAVKFDLDEVVVLEAEAQAGSVFAGWSGCEAEPSPTECEVTMDEAREVTVAFDALPRVVATSAQPILYDEATLRGEVDPSGAPTEYRFEYLTEKEYEDNGETFAGAQQTPIEDLGPTKGFIAVDAPLTGLVEGAQYRFRLRAMNTIGPAEDEGPSFETLQRWTSLPCANAAYRSGLSANLPDCRAYELVTPAQTDGLVPYAANGGGTPSGLFDNWLTVQRGEEAGERLSYFTDGTLPGFEGNGRLDGYGAKRGIGDHPLGGWQSSLFSPSYTESAPGIKNASSQHGIAADQLYSVWEITPEPEAFPETLSHGVYLHTPEGFEVLGQGSLGEDLGALSRYVSAGGTHAIFTSRAHLEPGAPPAPTQAIYDRSAGKASASVVSAPPSGASPALEAEFESQDATYVGASEDGAAVAFKVGNALYLHREGATLGIAGAPNAFAGISDDGQRVFYAATANGGSSASLFACDTETGPCVGSGAHLAEEIAAAGIFAGVSPDGSSVFFSATEALTGSEENDNGEEAQPGARNLYAWNGGEVRFVSGLATSDFAQNAFAGISEMNLAAWTRAITFAVGIQSGRALAPVRSTPTGDVFVFQSHARLTSYDNKGLGEIYRYDPAAGAGERLLCVSCDPSGAPPSSDALLQDVRGFPGDPVQTTTMIANLTDGGKAVFFQSFDRLLPEDANEVEDVYEWEASGTNGCNRPGGCLALISSGQGETPSILYAMSANGHDVFFHTKEKLVGADEAGSPSIYDARMGGGIPEPTPPAPCQGDACQGLGSEPPVLPSPATSGAAEGNEASSTRPRCAKGKHRVKGRCVRTKHRKRHRRHRRAHTQRGESR